MTWRLCRGLPTGPSWRIAILVLLPSRIDRHETVHVTIEDQGRGIEDLELAQQPLYAVPELERLGMGFTIAENFMDGRVLVNRSRYSFQ
jgi:anti-sigma regulatory factor (Ser/Thr protein kinase)